jgi:hypothetical protein
MAVHNRCSSTVLVADSGSDSLEEEEGNGRISEDDGNVEEEVSESSGGEEVMSSQVVLSLAVEGDRSMVELDGVRPASVLLPAVDWPWEDPLGLEATQEQCRPAAVVVDLVPVPVELSVVGRLQARLEAWMGIGTLEQVLAWLSGGVPLSLWGEVEEDSCMFQFMPEQSVWLEQEISRLVQVGAIECMGRGDVRPVGVQVMAPVFLVPKKGPKRWRLVINLHHLNRCLVDRPCKFKSLKMLARLAGHKWWMITFDLAQGYHHVLVEPESRPLMGF